MAQVLAIVNDFWEKVAQKWGRGMANSGKKIWLEEKSHFSDVLAVVQRHLWGDKEFQINLWSFSKNFVASLWAKVSNREVDLRADFDIFIEYLKRPNSFRAWGASHWERSLREKSGQGSHRWIRRNLWLCLHFQPRHRSTDVSELPICESHQLSYFACQWEASPKFGRCKRSRWWTAEWKPRRNLRPESNMQKYLLIDWEAVLFSAPNRWTSLSVPEK